MHHSIKIVFLLIFITFSKILFSQCNIVCNENVGFFSNNDASTIGYDNIVSSFHTTAVAEELGYRIWGEMGGSKWSIPYDVDSFSFPGLKGKVLKVGLGSWNINKSQVIILTTNGLYAYGNWGIVVPSGININTYLPIVVNGKLDGLPIGITPDSVKMMFVTTGTITITTCGGSVYVLSRFSFINGTDSIQNSINWERILMPNGQPLTGIIAARGNSSFAFALKNDNTIWTWGNSVLIGDGTLNFNSKVAVQMVLPAGVSKVKMIQGTSSNLEYFDILPSKKISYYLLDDSSKLYALGANDYCQLAESTNIDKFVWVNCKYSGGKIIDDAKWISSNEHDFLYANLSVINSKGQVFLAGNNNKYMNGGINGGADPMGNYNNPSYLAMPQGIFASDTIHLCEVGGHTSMFIKKNTIRYGYLGHQINGSVGNNDNNEKEISSVDFITPPIIKICGTTCDTPIIYKKPYSCNDSLASFVIKGKKNTVVYLKINNVETDVTIGDNDSVELVYNSPNTFISINVYKVKTTVCEFSLDFNDTIFKNAFSVHNIIICNQNEYKFNSKTYFSTGNYIDTVKLSTGCDSLIYLNLNFLKTLVFDSFLNICEGNSVKFKDIDVSKEGLYSDTLYSSLGCDSIFNLHIKVDTLISSYNVIVLCNEGNYKGYSNEGDFEIRHKKMVGCDSIEKFKLIKKAPKIGNVDLWICNDDSIKINNRFVNAQGIYNDTIKSSDGCDSVLYINLKHKEISPKLLLNDTSICAGDTTLLRVSKNYQKYLWNTKDTTSEIKVFEKGIYIVAVTDTANCKAKDSAILSYLPIDSILISAPNECEIGSQIVLTAVGKNNGFVWMPKNLFKCDTCNQNTIKLDTSSYVYLKYKYQNQCYYIDSHYVEVYEKVEEFDYPNIFSPNNDYINDWFYPKSKNVNFTFKIFNRWGELLFVSSKEKPYWDGTYKGEYQSPGVYIVSFEGRYRNGKPLSKKGSLTLVR